MSDNDFVDVLAVAKSAGSWGSVRLALRELGANTLFAQSVDEAVARIQERDVALILVDMERDGIDAAKTFRRCRPQVPILFFGERNQNSYEPADGDALGTVDFLAKPVHVDALKSRAAILLELYKKTEEVRHQAELLRGAAEREHQRALAAARAQWEKSALRRNNERLRLLAATAARLLTEPRPEMRLERMCEDLVRHLDLDLAFAYLFSEPAGGLELICRVDVGDADASDDDAAALHRSAWLKAAVRDDELCVASSLQNSTSWELAPLRAFGLSTCACFPLIAHGRPLGALVFGCRTRAAFHEDELSLMGLLSDEIAMALDRARLIAELEAGTAELREADRRKNEFLAMLAHELRNPIAPILNALQLMRLQSEKAPIVDRALCAAERQATHLVRMVDDLLDISRITRGKLQLRQDRFQLADMIEQGVQAAENLVRSKNHELVLKLPAAPVFVFADPTRLEQIVANLLNNAARYTPAGGKIEVACHVEGRDVVIEVADNGVGIAPDMLERIFDTFVQVGAEPRGLEGGLGLGLTLVRNLSELHGGSAHAESQGPSSGTRFIVRLPIVVGPDRSDA